MTHQDGTFVQLAADHLAANHAVIDELARRHVRNDDGSCAACPTCVWWPCLVALVACEAQGARRNNDSGSGRHRGTEGRSR